MRPTVNDLARAAGVSLATVDRVLNARPGVRAQTIEAVNDAIQRIGYVRDVAAANLARGRNYRLAFVLPDTDSQFLDALVATLRRGSATAILSRTVVELKRFPPQDPHALAAILAHLAGQGIDGVAVMAPETPVLRDAIRALHAGGIAVVALVSDLPNTERDHFVGIDNRAAGRTAGVLMGRFLQDKSGAVAVLAQSMQLSEAVERRAGFDDVMQRDAPEVEVLPSLETHGVTALLRQVVENVLVARPDIGGIYITGIGQRALTDVLAERGLTGRIVVIGHELTEHARNALLCGRMDAVITQNVGHVMRSALRVLRAKIDGAPLDESQEQIRIEIVIRENLPRM